MKRIPLAPVLIVALCACATVVRAQPGPFAAQIQQALRSLGLLNNGFANGQIPVWNSSLSAFAPGAAAGGSVTSVSVVSANGLAGTVATPTTTPAITLTTTITGLLKGNATAISAAVSGTDYAPATTGSSVLLGSAGGFASATTQTCTNQVLTVLSAAFVGTCNTITSAYVNNSIALTGTDINTSNQVTVTHLAAALPIAQGGTNCISASITCFNNITGFTAAGTTGTTSTNVVFSTSPTLVTPALGTPTALTVNSSTTGTATIPVEFNLPTGISQAGTATATCSLPSSGAPVATAAASSTPLVGDLAFSGSALNTWECHFTLPHDWAGSSLFDVRFVWRAASTSGNVVWQAKFLVVPAASLLSGSYSAASTVTSAAQGTTLQLQTAAITGVTVAASAVDSEFFIQISRNGGSGSDTMTGTAELISARVILRRAITWGG